MLHTGQNVKKCNYVQFFELKRILHNTQIKYSGQFLMYSISQQEKMMQ